jgi:hypothetical protein
MRAARRIRAIGVIGATAGGWISTPRQISLALAGTLFAASFAFVVALLIVFICPRLRLFSTRRETHVASGGYADVGDYLRDLIRRDLDI